MKKILIGLAIVIVGLLGTGYFMMNQMRKKSPMMQEVGKVGTLVVELSYGAPSVRGRTVFSAKEDALQPFGTYWRLGANEMTTISFSEDVIFQGEPVPKGIYGMYAIPHVDSFEIRLNQEADRWGYSEPDYGLDIAKVFATTSKSDSLTETLSIHTKPNGRFLEIDMAWERYNWKVMVKPVNI